MGVRRNINSYQAMIYIKKQSTSFLLALASLSVVSSSSLVSCSESVGMSGVTLSDKKISFTATEVNGWTPNSDNSSNEETTRTVGSYHPLLVKGDLGKPLYLHPVEQVGTYFYNDKDELVTRSGILSSDLSDYEIPLGDNGIDIKTGVAKALTTAPLTLMMIPQKFDDNSTTEVEIVFDNGAGDRTLSAELKGTECRADALNCASLQKF